MTVVTGVFEVVRMYQHAHPASVERAEHLGDGWDSHVPLFKHSRLLHQEDVARHGHVGVLVRVVEQLKHISLGELVEDEGCNKGEETDGGDEGRLKSQTLCGHPGLEDEWHQNQTCAAVHVAETLHSWRRTHV